MRRSPAPEPFATCGCLISHMTQPQITYRGLPHSPAMDARIIELAAKLDELHPRITRCHVVVDELDRHKNKGNLFDVRIDLHVPGRELVATHQPDEDAYVAITNSFDVMFRQLEDVLRIQRGKVKRHRDDREGTPLP
jgi:ribosome-associated translation inhibitor RaiA